MNLVAPVVKLQPMQERVIEFLGLNRKPVINDGEMSDMLNLTADNYPLLTPRKARGFYVPEITEISGELMLDRTITQVHSISTRYDKIMMIADIEDEDDTTRTVFIYDKKVVGNIADMTPDTRMVCINTKVCFFPQKNYLQLDRDEEGEFSAGGYFPLDADVSTGLYATSYHVSSSRGSFFDITSMSSQNTIKSWLGTPTDSEVLSGVITVNINFVSKRTSASSGRPKQVNVTIFANGTRVAASTPWKVSSDSETAAQFANRVFPLMTSFISQKTGLTFEEKGSPLTTELPLIMAFDRNKDSTFTSEWTMSNEPTESTVTTSGTIEIISTSDGINHERILFSGGFDTASFKVGDAITIEAQIQIGDDIISYVGDTAISCIIDAVGDHYIEVPNYTFLEITERGATQATLGNTRIMRKSPDMDVETILEYNNRLWGASSVDNTIYACKLGDPTNWAYYQSTSMDSYYAEQGTDGKFTGAAAYSNHLMFFKESSIAKVYGTAPSSYQITNTKCFGLTADSPDSVAIINNMVFYKSSIGLMAYEGGDPYTITDKLNCKFRNVVCGTEGRKLYMSMFNEDKQEQELLCLDVDKAEWHKSDDTAMKSACTLNGCLYFVDGEGDVQVINPKAEDPDIEMDTDAINWMAVFGPFDEYIEHRKIYSKLMMRLTTQKGYEFQTGDSIELWIKIDDGVGNETTDGWEQVQTFTTALNDGEFIPIVPRRCDHYSVMIKGNVPAAIKSLTRNYRTGSGSKL